MTTMYLVTGATGHLGSTVVQLLLSQNHRVRALVMPGDPNLPRLDPRVQVVTADLRDKQALLPLFAKQEKERRIVIHTAGLVSIGSDKDPRVRQINVEGTRNIVQLCQETGVERLVHVSSVHAIPEKPQGQTMTEADHFDPSLVEGLYAKTKAEATQLVLDAADGGLNACVVHPSGILGPNDNGRGHMTQLVLDYAAGRLRACVKGGYDFVDVRDVAEGILACCEKGERGQCYILSGRFVSVRELMELLHQETGHKRIRTVLPWWLARLFAAPAALYYKIRRQPPLFTRYSLYTLRANAQFSYEKAEHFLGYHARPTEATVRDTVRWLASMGRIKLETP